MPPLETLTLSSNSTFTLFPSLPTELRLKIYSLALSVPRTLTLFCERKIIEGESRRATRFHSSSPPPSLLSVCQESRFEALCHYTPSFTSIHGPNLLYVVRTTIHKLNLLYVCFAQDTIRCSDRIIEYFGPEEREGIERLELEVSDASYFAHFHMETIRKMTGLKEVKLETKPNDVMGWSSGSRDVLEKDFKLERLEHLGWECPRVTMVEMKSGEVLGVIEGGAIVRGWKDGYAPEDCREVMMGLLMRDRDERPELTMNDI